MPSYTFENTFKIYLIRHGQSDVNTHPERVSIADRNSPLTNIGREQSKKLGNYLKNSGIYFDKIYSSSLDRAIETAQICSNTMESKIPICTVDSIVEWKPGDLEENLYLAKFTTEEELANKNIVSSQNSWFKPNNGESIQEAKERVCSWFNSEIIYNQNHKNLNLNIAIFAHGKVINFILMNIMGFDQHFASNLLIENTSVSYLEYSKLGWRIYSIGNTQHLI
jgi:broad specificity phosphatase PhoE